MKLLNFKTHTRSRLKTCWLNYAVEIDKYNLNIITQDYCELYFGKTIDKCNKNEGKIFVGIVSELIVGKAHRSRGLGDMLINKMEDYFKTIKCEYCQIDVFAYNENAIKFYAKHDYESRMVTMFKKLD